MIVAGGTLAALPFRRTTPGESPTPVDVPADVRSVNDATTPTSLGMLVDQGEPQTEWLDRLAPPQATATPPWPARRELSAPLTYEDLAVPITRPDQIERRFTALDKTEFADPNVSIAPNQDHAFAAADVVTDQASAAIDPQASAANTDRKQKQSVLVTESSERTTLASAPLNESGIERLPKKNTSTRKRFWIRQP
tara:strand:+ start:2035 stop:2619 length:585 start_codon:yes stop_codon:yes gene_type:complete